MKALARYSDVSNSNILALVVAAGSFAKPTDRTPLAEASSWALTRQKTSIEDVKALGDYFVDHEVGLVILYAQNGAYGLTPSDLIKASANDITFFAKAGASQAHRHIHIEGPVRPGDKLGYDIESNFVVSGSTNDASGGGVILGKVLEIASLPKGLLDRVTTAFTGSSFDATAQMPGSATKGYSDMITLSGESVADEIATINLRV